MSEGGVRELEGLPLGFQWGAVRAGIKASGNLDVAIALVDGGADAAAMWTRNQVVAAPVVVGRRHLEAAGGRVKVVLVNAGNANCATGEAGLRACEETCRAAAEAFYCEIEEVFPSSTGIIGVPLPTKKIVGAMAELKGAIGATEADAERFATAMMTTDTKRKMARAVIEVGGREARILGVAKGAGMIHPQLVGAGETPHATMLVYLFTDVVAGAEEMRAALGPAVEQSFNSMSIDGDTSTNDTVLLLASGASGVTLDATVEEAFATALKGVCGSLAHQIVDDGEGVGHVVTLVISGARTDAEAKQVAKAIAHSPLNKTAWSKADPNWGRLLAAAGYAGVRFSVERVRIWIGEQQVFEDGMRAAGFDREAAHAVMSQREYTIRMDLGEGVGRCTFLTCDLTEEYVRINAEYST